MSRPFSCFRRRGGFTFVELLLAVALGALVAAILGALLHGLFSTGERQAERLRGPVAARAATRQMLRELACAFAPPVEELPPLVLSVSTEVARPETTLSFYAPVPAAGGYDIEAITYEIVPMSDGVREWRRTSTPCSGPFTNAPNTLLLYRGPFSLQMEAMSEGEANATWPPANDSAQATNLPASVRFTLSGPGAPPLQTETLLHAATKIKSPIERTPPE